MNVDAITATAFINTDVAASFGCRRAFVWLLLTWWLEKKPPKFVDWLTGAGAWQTGKQFTPAAGYVSVKAAKLL